MSTKIEVLTEGDNNQTLPLLTTTSPTDPDDNRNQLQEAISQAFQSTAHLANLLPTGTVLAFHLLAPIFTNAGDCDDASKLMTSVLIAICAFACFVLSFSDTFKDTDGTVYHGFATFRGLWVIDGSVEIPPEQGPTYRIQFIDFVHGFMSVLVFTALALLDKNTVQCYYPTPSKRAMEVLTGLPLGIGVMCSMMFVTFPTKRHGIGFPLTPS